MGYIRSMKISSVEITFKRQPIIEAGVRFNESFGSGSGMYAMGEENIFLYDCLKRKLKIFYLPIEIGKVNDGNSTWFKGFNEKYFFDLGACFAAMGGYLAWIYILQYAIRKYKIYKNATTFKESIKYMLHGAINYAHHNDR